MINVRINKETGKIPKQGETNTIMETFVVGTEPGSQEENTLPFEDTKDDLFDEGEYFNNQ